MARRSETNPTTNTSSFTGVMELSKTGATSVPPTYILPPNHRPNLGAIVNPAPNVPPIDLSLLQHPDHKPQIFEQIRVACKELGFFQVVNHGIPSPVMSNALDAATEFFDLPHEEKLTLASGDVHEPVRYGTSLTIILQNHQGLEIMDRDNRWHQIPIHKGALVIQMGDQLEILSNGQYRSPIHRATVNTDSNRISIASLHSLALDQRVGPALELINDENPPLYRQGSFTEFLDFISKNDILLEGRYLDTLKINQ